MKVLYIGQYSDGTTSKMRGEVIRELLNPDDFNIIDIHVPFYNTSKFWRTIGFRFKIGCLISEINTYVLTTLVSFQINFYDLIWVDKGVFLNLNTINSLKKLTNKLIHYTPDMAFYANKSRRFERSIPLFDFLVTTKSNELPFYQKIAESEKIILTTQGFSKHGHKPYDEYEGKDDTITFIGLAEPNRFAVAEKLILNDIKLKLAGKGWSEFVKKYQDNSNLIYFGEGVFGESYSKLISSSKFAIGLLSKRFPELHTTRTFEIPACGTALLTEKNKETLSFYNNDEVIFYDDLDDLIKKIKYFQKHKEELKLITKRGYLRVHDSGYDYHSILLRVLNIVLNEKNNS